MRSSSRPRLSASPRSSAPPGVKIGQQQAVQRWRCAAFALRVALLLRRGRPDRGASPDAAAGDGSGSGGCPRHSVPVAKTAVAAQRFVTLAERDETAVGAALVILRAPLIARALLGGGRSRRGRDRRRGCDGKEHGSHIGTPSLPGPNERTLPASRYFMTGTRGSYATSDGIPSCRSAARGAFRCHQG